MKLNRLFKYTNDYRYNSILFKNTGMLLLFSLLPLIVIIFLSNFYYSASLKNEMISRYSQSNSMVENSFTTMVDGYFYHINDLLTSDALDTLSHIKSADELMHQNYFDLVRRISLIENAYDYTENIYVYKRDVGLLGSLGLIQEGMDDEPFLENYNNIKNPKASGFETYLWKENDKNILTIAKPYVSFNTTNIIIFVNIDIEKMMQPIIEPYMSEDGAFILESEGTPIYISNNSSISDVKIAQSVKFATSTSGYQQTNIQGHDWMAIKGKPTIANLSYLFLIPMSVISSELITLRIALVIMVIFCVLLLFGLAIYISNRMYRPISNLLDSVNALPFISEKKESFHDEITYISDTLNKLVTKHSELEGELQERIKLFQKAQFVALQSQITPHFLCNTLDNINWMSISKLGGENEISSMVTHLSSLLRVSLESSVSVHSLEKEINNAREYLLIMEKRYEGRFDVNWDIPDDILSLPVPKITLQPIIENAIYHGIKPYEKKGFIAVKSAIEDDNLKIIITDSGNGFSEKDIETINKELAKNYMKEDNHIGISNVNMRIKLLFGERYGVTVGNCNEGGAKITITLPLQPQKTKD